MFQIMLFQFSGEEILNGLMRQFPTIRIFILCCSLNLIANVSDAKTPGEVPVDAILRPAQLTGLKMDLN